MLSELERIRLIKRRNGLLQQLNGLGNLMRGTLTTSMLRCGAPHCDCARAKGLRHPKLHLSVHLNGRTRGVYVSKKNLENVEGLIAEYERAWRIINELTAVNLELLRPTRNPKERKS
jgi:hypothetical protein